MAAFIFFSTVWRRLMQPPTGAPQMLRDGDFDTDGTGDPASDNDRVYGDALLDLQMRRFFKREYGHAQPPESAFVRLMRATAQYAVRNTHHVSRFPSLTESAYHALTGQLTTRLLSSGVALAVLLAVLGANASQLLRGGEDEVYRDAPAAANALSQEEWRDRLEAKDAEQPTPEPLAYRYEVYGQVDPSDDLIMTSPHRPLKQRQRIEQQDSTEPPLRVGSQF